MAEMQCVKELYNNGVECSEKGGRTNVHEEEQSGRLSVMSSKCWQKKLWKRRFTISELLCEFQKISGTVLHEIVIG
jgi:hypothetical protein